MRGRHRSWRSCYRGVTAPWCVAAGWALDLFRGEQTREHEDLEIAVPTTREAFGQVRNALAGYEIEDGRRAASGHSRRAALRSTSINRRGSARCARGAGGRGGRAGRRRAVRPDLPARHLPRTAAGRSVGLPPRREHRPALRGGHPPQPGRHSLPGAADRAAVQGKARQAQGAGRTWPACCLCSHPASAAGWQPCCSASIRAMTG